MDGGVNPTNTSKNVKSDQYQQAWPTGRHEAQCLYGNNSCIIQKVACSLAYLASLYCTVFPQRNLPTPKKLPKPDMATDPKSTSYSSGKHRSLRTEKRLSQRQSKISQQMRIGAKRSAPWNLKAFSGPKNYPFLPLSTNALTNPSTFETYFW
jgi:hypothetical protein